MNLFISDADYKNSMLALSDALEVAEILDKTPTKNFKSLSQDQRQLCLEALTQALADQDFGGKRHLKKEWTELTTEGKHIHFAEAEQLKLGLKTEIEKPPTFLKILNKILSEIGELLGVWVSASQLKKLTEQYHQKKDAEAKELAEFGANKLQNDLKDTEDALRFFKRITIPMTQNALELTEKIKSKQSPEKKREFVINLIKDRKTYMSALSTSQDADREDIIKAIEDHLSGLISLNKTKSPEEFDLQVDLLIKRYQEQLKAYASSVIYNEVKTIPSLKQKLAYHAQLVEKMQLREKTGINRSDV